jgi:hypothetical protein
MMVQQMLDRPGAVRRATPASASATQTVKAAEAAAPTGSRAPFVLLGGLPGAGKSTAIAEVAGGLSGVGVLDSDSVRDAIGSRLPVGTPYRHYRPVVHALHQWTIVWRLLRGPGASRGLLVLARLAHLRGWQPRLVFIDVDPAVALRGQHDRARVVAAEAFARHTRRWQAQRDLITTETPWSSVDIVSRAQTPACLRSRLAGG